MRYVTVTKHILIAAALLSTLTTKAHSAEWYFIGNTNQTSFFVEKSSIKTNGNIKSCWTSHVYQSNKNGIDQSTNHMLINCKDRTIGQDKWIGYSKDGNVVDSVIVKPSYEATSPDSMADKIMTSVCSGKFFGKPQSTLEIDAIRHVIAQIIQEQ